MSEDQEFHCDEFVMKIPMWRDAHMKEQRARLESLRVRQNQNEAKLDPLLEDFEGIQLANEVPAQAFGEHVVSMKAREDFGVSWVDAIEAPTLIAKGKALAEPVATLASGKLPSTTAEAEYQVNHSSYVFKKRINRKKNR